MKRIKHGMIVGAAALLLMTGCGSNASTADLQKQIERLEAENAELKEQLNEPQEINVDEFLDDGTSNASEQEASVEPVDYASMIDNAVITYLQPIRIYNDVSEIQAGDLIDITVENLKELSTVLVIENVPVYASAPEGIGIYIKDNDNQLLSMAINSSYRITLSKKDDISNIDQIAIVTINKLIILAPLPDGETDDYELWFPEGREGTILVRSDPKNPNGQMALVIGDKTYQFTVDTIAGTYTCTVKGTYEKGTLSISGINKEDYQINLINGVEQYNNQDK